MAAALVLFAVLALLLLLRLLVAAGVGRRARLKLPPSPATGWPAVLGHLALLQQILTARAPMSALRNRYGPVWRLHVGSHMYMLIVDPDAAHDAFVQQGANFASRPTLSSATATFSCNYRTISSAPYNATWRTLRRALVTGLLPPAKLHAFKPSRAQLVDRLVGRLRGSSQGQGLVVVYPVLKAAVFELMLLMCLGIHVDYYSHAAVQELDRSIEQMLAQYVTVESLADFFPLLGKPFAWCKQHVRRKILASQAQAFSELLRQRDLARAAGQLVTGNYVEILENVRLQDEQQGKKGIGGVSTEDQNLKSNLSHENIIALCTELLIGGTDTTISCLEWAIAELTNNPHIQDKLYQEIEVVIGVQRDIHEDDLGAMPYLQAIVMETLRLHPPGHTLFPHLVSESCKVAGYDFPAGAIVDCHMPSISRSPKLWESALEFKPERFLHHDGALKEVDITGTRELTMIPFGIGRRICPGSGLALLHVTLVIGRLIQEFQWDAPTSCPNGRVDLTEKLGFTAIMQNPLRVFITPRR